MKEHGRFSFIGGRPMVVFTSKGYDMVIQEHSLVREEHGHPFETIRTLLQKYAPAQQSSAFSGGAIGYIAYDAVRLFERIPDRRPCEIDIPDLYFIIPSEIIVIDRREKIITINTFGGSARGRVIIDSIMDTRGEEPKREIKRDLTYASNMSKEFFCTMVEKAQERILAGDIFQVVLSQRLSIPVKSTSLSIYKALCLTNPSPYMYYLNLKGLSLLGSSPETLVKVERGRVLSRPIAGTRPRGRSNHEDHEFEQELVKDEKELAEHIMLVDLARNDVGRVCNNGSVSVTDLLCVERYARVMHITSNVSGILHKKYDAFDVLAATFPAGTVSGAPKIRAMEIIDELEPVKRGFYAGAIGYFGYNGDMDFCIAIRTIMMHNKIAYFQGGAGIVADSNPEKEYVETLDKMSALKSTLEIAQ